MVPRIAMTGSGWRACWELSVPGGDGAVLVTGDADASCTCEASRMERQGQGAPSGLPGQFFQLLLGGEVYLGSFFSSLLYLEVFGFFHTGEPGVEAPGYLADELV